MDLSEDTVGGILSRLIDENVVTDYASEYGEPGYDSQGRVVALGNFWCRCGKLVDENGRENLHDHGHHRPHLWAKLEEYVDFVWYDEWTVICETDKAYRTQPDSYSWLPSVVLDEDGEWLTPDDDLDEWVEWAINDPSRALVSSVYTGSDLEAAGWSRFNGQFASGWYAGQDDDPAAVTAVLRREHENVDVVFAIDGTGQFDMHFSAYYKAEDESED